MESRLEMTFFLFLPGPPSVQNDFQGNLLGTGLGYSDFQGNRLRGFLCVKTQCKFGRDFVGILFVTVWVSDKVKIPLQQGKGFIIHRLELLSSISDKSVPSSLVLQ